LVLSQDLPLFILAGPLLGGKATHPFLFLRAAIPTMLSVKTMSSAPVKPFALPSLDHSTSCFYDSILRLRFDLIASAPLRSIFCCQVVTLFVFCFPYRNVEWGWQAQHPPCKTHSVGYRKTPPCPGPRFSFFPAVILRASLSDFSHYV